jgi:hypothetical protein
MNELKQLETDFVVNAQMDVLFSSSFSSVVTFTLLFN